MKRRLLLLLGLLALTALVVVWLAVQRVEQARHLTEPCTVRTYGNTNYVAQILDATVGRTDNGYLVIAAVRLQNPNPFDVELARNWFLLVDSDKDYYEPSTTGTQTATIRLPAGGAVDRELLSFAVGADAFQGMLAVQLGRNYWLMIKEPTPYTPKLRPGEFITFHRRNW